MHDDEIVPLLQRERRPTFFTRDDDFYDRSLCHPRYCIAYLAVTKSEVATFVRRLLRHAALNTLGISDPRFARRAKDLAHSCHKTTIP